MQIFNIIASHIVQFKFYEKRRKPKKKAQRKKIENVK